MIQYMYHAYRISRYDIYHQNIIKSTLQNILRLYLKFVHKDTLILKFETNIFQKKQQQVTFSQDLHGLLRL